MLEKYLIRHYNSNKKYLTEIFIYTYIITLIHKYYIKLIIYITYILHYINIHKYYIKYLVYLLIIFRIKLYIKYV